jgi:hypothetical protein
VRTGSRFRTKAYGWRKLAYKLIRPLDYFGFVSDTQVIGQICFRLCVAYGFVRFLTPLQHHHYQLTRLQALDVVPNLQPPDIAAGEGNMLPSERREMPQRILGLNHSMPVKDGPGKIQVDNIPQNNHHDDQCGRIGSYEFHNGLNLLQLYIFCIQMGSSSIELSLHRLSKKPRVAFLNDRS